MTKLSNIKKKKIKNNNILQPWEISIPKEKSIHPEKEED